MPEPLFDPPDSTPAPAAVAESAPAPAPTPSAPTSPSIVSDLGGGLGASDIFTGKPIDVSTFIKDDYSYLQEKIGSEKAATDTFERRQDDYHRAQERLF